MSISFTSCCFTTLLSLGSFSLVLEPVTTLLYCFLAHHKWKYLGISVFFFFFFFLLVCMRFHCFFSIVAFLFCFFFRKILSSFYFPSIVLISDNIWFFFFFDSELSVGKRTNTSTFPLAKDFLISFSSLLPVLSHWTQEMKRSYFSHMKFPQIHSFECFSITNSFYGVM